MEIPSQQVSSHLEGFHRKVAHFGNTGMAIGLSDCLMYRGAAEHNVVVRHDLSQGEGWLLQHTPPAPEHICQHPPFVDHLLLERLNEQAREAKLDAPFKHVRATPKDNGKVFLSEYFEEQEKRNIKTLTYPNTRRCLCAECWKNPLPYIKETIGISDATATPPPPITSPSTSTSPTSICPSPSPATDLDPTTNDTYDPPRGVPKVNHVSTTQHDDWPRHAAPLCTAITLQLPKVQWLTLQASGRESHGKSNQP
jgi:hypothetical protein